MKKGKLDLAAHVSGKLITLMEDDKTSGNSWERAWIGGANMALPVNATTQDEYRGINIILLTLQAHVAGYSSNLWATYNQWKSIGAQVRAGEQHTKGVFYGTYDKKTGGIDASGAPEVDRYKYLKQFQVFNACQVDGFAIACDQSRPDLAKRIESAEAFVANCGADIRYTEDRRAYYRRRDASGAGDYINMPALDLFTDTKHSTATENHYSTLLHELTHWTGDKRRLDREKGARFGDSKYAFEELIAELGAAFLCAHLGISSEPRVDHAQYLNNWIQALKDHPNAIMTAGARASDALDYLRAKQEADAVAA